MKEKVFTGLSLMGILYKHPTDDRIKMIIGIDPKFATSKEEAIEILQKGFEGGFFSVDEKDLTGMTIIGEDLWSGN